MPQSPHGRTAWFALANPPPEAHRQKKKAPPATAREAFKKAVYPVTGLDYCCGFGAAGFVAAGFDGVVDAAFSGYAWSYSRITSCVTSTVGAP